MRYEVEILSPLHIGDGTSSKGLDYYILNNQVNFIDTGSFSSLPPNIQKAFIDEYEKNQRISLTKFLSIHNTSFKPKYSVKFVLERMQGDEEIINFIKSNSRPIIPGSEIKGAIRTAMLYKYFKDNPTKFNEMITELTSIRHRLTQLLNEYKNAQKQVRETGRQLGAYKENCMKKRCKPLMDLMRRECVNCRHFNGQSQGTTPEELLALKKDKPDSLYCKFVKDREPQGCKKNLISKAIRGEFDTQFRFNCTRCSFFQNENIRSEYSNLHESYFKQLKVNRENTHEIWKNEMRRVSDYLNELIEKYENHFFNLLKDDIKTSLFRYLIITDSSPMSLSQLIIAEERITHKNQRTENNLHKFIKEYISTTSKSKLEITLQKDKALLFFGENKKELDTDYIRKACNEFALAKVSSELDYFSSSDFKNRREYESVRNFYNGLKEEITKDNQSIFLRMGAGQGLMSITIDLLLKDKPFFKPLIANLKEKRDGADLQGTYPASRRVVNLGNEYLPPGWICLREVR